MNSKEFDQRWNELAEDVMTGMREWRVQHPRATFRQTHAPASWAGVETALDERLTRTRTCCAVGAGVRARMLEDLALASTAADWEQAPESEHPVCPQCGQRLQRESQHTRHLQTQGGQDLRLERRYGTCPACGAGLFPPRACYALAKRPAFSSIFRCAIAGAASPCMRNSAGFCATDNKFITDSR